MMTTLTWVLLTVTAGFQDSLFVDLYKRTWPAYFPLSDCLGACRLCRIIQDLMCTQLDTRAAEVFVRSDTEYKRIGDPVPEVRAGI